MSFTKYDLMEKYHIKVKYEGNIRDAFINYIVDSYSVNVDIIIDDVDSDGNSIQMDKNNYSLPISAVMKVCSF